MKAEELVSDNHDFFLSETTITTEVSTETLVTMLRARRTTGQLVIHFSQGGIQKVQLVERKKANENQAKKMRELFGFQHA